MKKILSVFFLLAAQFSIAGGLGGPPSASPLKPPPFSNCPRIDFVALNKKLAAINFNRYTIGHARMLEISRGDGAFKRFESGYLPFYEKTGVRVPEESKPCDRPLPVEISIEKGEMIVEGVSIVRFHKFEFTKELQVISKESPFVSLPRGSKLDFSNRNAVTGKVSGGPQRPQPSDGGGAGGPKGDGTGSPGDIPFDPPTGPKCCRGGA